MEIDQILGGVSPLKARSGKHARAATSTASKRGGYSKSTSSSNRGGYNRHTRFQADKWTPPPSGGDIGPAASTSAPVATAPYSGGGGTNYSFDSNDVNTINQTAYGGGGTKETTEIKKVKKKTVQDFESNCYDSNGKFLEGHIYINSENNRIVCKLGGEIQPLEEQKVTTKNVVSNGDPPKQEATIKTDNNTFGG
jgi:hypothetical protein